MNSDFKDLLSLFNAVHVKYLIIGGVAFIFHAEPRYTKDIDIWVKPEAENAARIYAALREFGAPLSDITPDDFSNPDLFYQMGRPPGRVDVLMSVLGLDFDTAWSRRVEADIDDIPVPFISKDDLITTKLASGRPQDLLDVQTLRMKVKSIEEVQTRDRGKAGEL